jgi:hypothetical protein
VVREDRKLDSTKESAAEALMKLRWHWTLDESNPKRVKIEAYAKAVGKHHSTISADAKGYVLIRGGAPANEARERAGMSAQTEAATEAVAKARGVSFSHTRKDRPVEVRRVREMARQRAEDKGTSVEEEAPKAAAAIVRAENTEHRVKAQRDEHRGLRFIEVEGSLAKAQKELLKAVDSARHAGFDDDEIELLVDSLAKVRAVLNLIDAAVAGSVNVDWDAELVKLGDPV